MSNTAEILLAARDMIKDERNWCRKSIARDDKGNRCRLINHNTHSFCAEGALMKAYIKVGKNKSFDGYRNVLKYIRQFLPDKYTFVYQFNNDIQNTHKDIIGLFNDAIAGILSSRRLPNDQT